MDPEPQTKTQPLTQTTGGSQRNWAWIFTRLLLVIGVVVAVFQRVFVMAFDNGLLRFENTSLNNSLLPIAYGCGILGLIIALVTLKDHRKLYMASFSITFLVLYTFSLWPAIEEYRDYTAKNTERAAEIQKDQEDFALTNRISSLAKTSAGFLKDGDVPKFKKTLAPEMLNDSTLDSKIANEWIPFFSDAILPSFDDTSKGWSRWHNPKYPQYEEIYSISLNLSNNGGNERYFSGSFAELDDQYLMIEFKTGYYSKPAIKAQN